MDIHKELEDLRTFTTKVLDEKRVSTDTKSSNRDRARVESTFVSAPMTPRTFEQPAGRTPRPNPFTEAATTNLAGAFYRLYEQDGSTFLQGGTVTGGDGTETIADIEVINGSGPLYAAGIHLYIHASGSGVVEDGVLLPGWNQSSASVSNGASVPSNNLPTATSESGDVYVDLGVFTETEFLPAAAGPIDVSFCPGHFTILR